jgi:hypothetical protein
VLLETGISVGRCGNLAVDHRYQSERQYTLLNFPFDYRKTILLGNGSLAYDFGPGPYHEAGTEIGLGLSGEQDSVTGQYFADPRIPVATTVIQSGSTRCTVDAFCIVPPSTDFTSSFTCGPVRRLGHLAGATEWAEPVGNVDPAFRGAAWGTNRPIEYRVKVSPGSDKVVLLGVCEGYKTRAGQRVLEYRVEGAPPQTIDPVGDGKRNVPYVLVFAGRDVNGDGEISIEAHFAPESGDPNVILNAFWVFPAGTTIDTGAVIRGELSGKAEVYWRCGRELDLLSPTPRTDALIASFKREGPVPALVITTRRPVRYDMLSKSILLAPGMVLRTLPPPEAGTSAGSGPRKRWTFPFPRGTTRVELRLTQSPGKFAEGKTQPLGEELNRARKYWKSQRVIPEGRIVIPDSALQGILDVNIRTMYQAADMVDGAPVFQPGPTVYRGLFLYDLLLMGEPLLALGDTASARKFIEGTFHYQQQDGRLRVLTPANSFLETPVFVHAMGRYARLSQNKRWMEIEWPRMVSAVNWIRNVRRETMRDTAAPGYGLFPPGFVDGGLAGSVPDFSTATFALMALETAAGTARWLGHLKEEKEWRWLFDDLLAAYTHAARRSQRHDRFGTMYIPVAVGDTSTSAPPQRGQYGLLGALRYAKYFSSHNAFLDSIAAGNLTMLDSTLSEGMIRDAGWTSDAVWSWLGLAHASALSSRGEGGRAATMVYDVANHSGRFGTWVEEQQIRGKGTRSTGDGSDAETSACLVGAIRDLLYFERGDTLEILPGVPDSWFRPGAHIAIHDVPTEWGRLTLDALSSRSGVRIRVSLTGPAAGGTDAPFVSVRAETLRNIGHRDDRMPASPLLRRYDRRKGLEIRVSKQGSFLIQE